MFYSAKTRVLIAPSLDRLDFTPSKSSRITLLDDSNSADSSPVNRIASILQSGTFWLDFEATSRTNLRNVCKLFNIHPLTVEDILAGLLRFY
jgi:Mg2+ and Co2+ transporter CorA